MLWGPPPSRSFSTSLSQPRRLILQAGLLSIPRKEPPVWFWYALYAAGGCMAVYAVVGIVRFSFFEKPRSPAMMIATTLLLAALAASGLALLGVIAPPPR